ncbi:MAG TPA: hypothetical protein VFE46_07070 [Pirellulales bacterium]|jgi:hypothetical protein|nr:hypothetical protein [Pirellulales bacterium]
MKMTKHMRRFSMPPPGFTVANHGGLAAAKKSSPPVQTAPLATLAQIYASAREQALATVQRRQWDALCDRLFNS